jgi:DNA adenine methylase
MKPLISYYGGKQNLVNELISCLPQHSSYESYVEPFFGGGALFFAKQPSIFEVINDTNEMLITLYRVAVTQRWELIKMIKGTMCSFVEYKRASLIYRKEVESTELEKAWAIYVLALQGFSGLIDIGWGRDRKHTRTAPRWDNHKKDLVKITDRLKNVQVDCRDALEVISYYDNEKTLFYLDPPYFNSDCGHYSGYSKNDYQQLIDMLINIKGKFMLSSYPSEIIDSMDWVFRKDIKQTLRVQGGRKETKYKTETIITNYKLPQLQLF